MPVYSHRQFSSNLALAMQDAAVLAREWQQDWLGVEHLFSALQAREPEEVDLMLQPFGFTGAELARVLKKHFNMPSGRPVPQAHPLAPRVQAALDLAESECKLAGRRTTECLDVLQSLFELDSYFLMVHAADLTKEVTGFVRFPWQSRFLAYAHRLRQDRWEFPVEALPVLRSRLQSCGRLHGVPESWELRQAAWVVKSGWASAYLSTQCEQSVIRLQLAERHGWQTGRQRCQLWLSRGLYRRLRAALAEVPGGQNGLPGALYDRSEDEAYGSLQHGWFEGKRAVPPVRRITASEVRDCQQIYTRLVQNKQVPVIDAQEIEKSLIKESANFFGIHGGEHGTTLMAFGGLTLPNVAQNLRVANLVFNLVDPAHHRKGYWRTLVAVQLLVAWRAGYPLIYLSAFSASRPCWEAVGVRFGWATHKEFTEFHGWLRVTEVDALFLENWLLEAGITEV